MLVVMTREDIAWHHTVLCSTDTQMCCSTFSQVGAVATRSNTVYSLYNELSVKTTYVRYNERFAIREVTYLDY